MSTRIMVAVAAVLALGVGPAMAQMSWSEDFDSYTGGQALSDGTNPNGWAGGVASVTYGVTFDAQSTINNPATTTVRDFGGGDIRVVDTGTTAAQAALPVYSNSAVFRFGYTGADVNTRTLLGFQLRDTIHGGSVTIHTDYAGWLLDTNEAGQSDGQYFADYSAYSIPNPQTVVLTLDFVANTAQATASFDDGSLLYYPTTQRLASESSPVMTLPADFVPNSIVVFSRWNHGSDIDNVLYTPEPASLALLSLGGLLLARRRRR